MMSNDGTIWTYPNADLLERLISNGASNRQEADQQDMGGFGLHHLPNCRSWNDRFQPMHSDDPVASVRVEVSICLPWMVTFLVYSLMHWSYPRDIRHLEKEHPERMEHGATSV